MNRHMKERCGVKQQRHHTKKSDEKATTHRIEYNPNDQAAARARCNVLALCKLASTDFESITARAWIVEDFGDGVPCHVLDFDLVIISPHRELLMLCWQVEVVNEKFAGTQRSEIAGHWRVQHVFIGYVVGSIRIEMMETSSGIMG